MSNKLKNSVIANLTFVVGQIEELKSNINDTVRYIKQNPEKWDTNEKEEDSTNESKKEENATVE